MEVFQTIINYVLNLGSAIFVPLIILILGLLAGMKLKKAFMSALTLGIAFSGMSMVIGYMSNAVSPASEALAKNTGISLPALDLKHHMVVELCFYIFCSNDWGQFCTVTF